MASLTNFQILIDLTEVDPDLESEALEDLASSVADEIGELVEDVKLVRETDIPAGGKPALAGFVLGILQAEVNFKNAKVLLDFLGDRFYGKNLPLKFEANGKKYEFEYRNKEQLADALAAIEKLTQISSQD
jgi:hypothetical protein